MFNALKELSLEESIEQPDAAGPVAVVVLMAPLETMKKSVQGVSLTALTVMLWALTCAPANAQLSPAQYETPEFDHCAAFDSEPFGRRDTSSR